MREYYDALGHKTRVVYDALGRQAETYDALDRKTVTTYDHGGRVANRFDNKARHTLTEYDDLGRVWKTTDRAGKVTTRIYYPDSGLLEKIEDAEGKETTYEYDDLGRREKTKLADNSETSVTYDGANRVLKTTYPTGKSRTNVWREEINGSPDATDVAGVLRQIDYLQAGGLSAGTDEFTYDNFLRQTGTTSRYNVTTSRSYELRGLVASDVTSYGGKTYTVACEYDRRGRKSKTTYPSTRAVDYTYTDRSEVDLIHWNGQQIEDCDYDKAMRLTDVLRPSVNENRTYFNDNRIQTISNGPVGTATYAYDGNGNKQSETWDGVTAPYTFSTERSGAADFPEGYDQEDRFVNFIQSGSSSDIAITRSEIGNIKTIGDNGSNPFTRIYSDAHELADAGPNLSQTFNDDGNVVNTVLGGDCEWDESNLLRKVTKDGIVTEYGYCATGKRAWKKVTEGSDVSETVYVCGGSNCVAEYAKGADPSVAGNEYVYSLGIDSLVMLSRSNGNANYTVTRNQQWSVTSLVDSVGNVVERYAYDVFGKRTILDTNGAVRIGSNYNMPYGYTSRRHEAETGLMYFRARYYDPTTGEFISRDPLEYVDGMSLYRAYFVPRGVDPFGLDWLDCFADCVAANDPMNVIVDHFLARLVAKLTVLGAGGGVPKSFMAWFAKHVMKDPKLAKDILWSAKRGGPLGLKPGKIIASWITKNRGKAARFATKAGPVLIAYGLALVAIEVDCAIHCCGKNQYTGGNLIDLDSLIDEIFNGATRPTPSTGPTPGTTFVPWEPKW